MNATLASSNTERGQSCFQSEIELDYLPANDQDQALLATQDRGANDRDHSSLHNQGQVRECVA